MSLALLRQLIQLSLNTTSSVEPPFQLSMAEDYSGPQKLDR